MAMFDSAMNSLWAGMQAGLKNRPTPRAPSAEPRLTLEAQMEWSQSLRDRVREVSSPQDLASILSDINTFAPRLFPGGVDDLPRDLRPGHLQASFGINPNTGTMIPAQAQPGAGGTEPAAAATASGGQPAGTERTQFGPLQGPPSEGIAERDAFFGMTDQQVAAARRAPDWRRLGYGSKKAYREDLKDAKSIMNNEAATLVGPQTADMFMNTLGELSGDAPPTAVLRDQDLFPLAIATHQTALQQAGFSQDAIDSRIERWWKVHDKMVDGMEARDAMQSAEAERQEELFQDIALLTSRVLGVTGPEVENFDDLKMGNMSAILGSGHGDLSRVLVHAADLVKKDGMTLPQAYQALAEKFAGKLDSWPIEEVTAAERRAAPKPWPKKWREAYDGGVLPKKGYKYAMRDGEIIQYVVRKDEAGNAEIIEPLTRYLNDHDLEVYRTADSKNVSLERAEEIVAMRRMEDADRGGRRGRRQRQAGLGGPDTGSPELQRAGAAFDRALQGRFGIVPEGESPQLQTMVGDTRLRSVGDLLFGGMYDATPRGPRGVAPSGAGPLVVPRRR
jgi:hypothetical protein